jgi:hypothetical protein
VPPPIKSNFFISFISLSRENLIQTFLPRFLCDTHIIVCKGEKSLSKSSRFAQDSSDGRETFGMPLRSGVPGVGTCIFVYIRPMKSVSVDHLSCQVSCQNSMRNVAPGSVFERL